MTIDTIVRDEIKNMSGFNSDEELEAYLPESTVSTTTEFPPADNDLTPTGRKKRKLGPRKKKLDDTGEPTDKRIERFKERATGLGGKSVVTVGFEMSGQPLKHEEDEELGDFFYALSKKANIDPTENWILLGLYFVFMLSRFIVARTNLGDEIKKFLSPHSDKSEDTEITDDLRDNDESITERSRGNGAFNIESAEQEIGL